MSARGTAVVVTDASVLINLTHTGHLHLLGALPDFHFVVPEAVTAEITAPEQRTQLHAAFRDGHLEQIRVDRPGELTVYAALRQHLDEGESACLARAAVQASLVACDERGVV